VYRAAYEYNLSFREADAMSFDMPPHAHRRFGEAADKRPGGCLRLRGRRFADGQLDWARAARRRADRPRSGPPPSYPALVTDPDWALR
jgi:hypothetical protein